MDTISRAAVLVAIMLFAHYAVPPQSFLNKIPRKLRYVLQVFLLFVSIYVIFDAPHPVHPTAFVGMISAGIILPIRWILLLQPPPQEYGTSASLGPPP